MYTIKQAAARTGLAIPTIRAWERRYGVVSPARTPAGYRLYDDAAIERLAAMRHLVETDGWRPSQAAVQVVAPGVDLPSLASRSRASGQDGGVGGRVRPAPIGDGAVAAFAAAARDVDVERLEQILDEAFAAQRFELAMDTVVFPGLRAIGAAWADGGLDVGAEHAASETVRRRLARYFDAAQGPATAPRVLIGMPPGGRHELGVFAFAVACRRASVGVAYLGMDVPLESWLGLTLETAIVAVVLGTVTSDDAIEVARVADALGTMDGSPVCFVGGPASPDVAPSSGAIALPASLDEAVDVVAAALTGADRRPRRRPSGGGL